MDDNQEQAIQNAAVQFSEGDYLHFIREIRRPNRKLFILQGGCVLALAGIAWLAADAISDTVGKIFEGIPSVISPLIQLGCFLAIYLCALRFFTRYLLRGQFNSKGNFLNAARFKLFPKFFTVENRYSYTRMDWRGVLKVVSTKDLILLYTDNVQAHIVPKRCFASPEAAEAFYQQALTYWKAAQAAPQPEAAP